MVEDSVANLAPAKALRMVTVLVTPNGWTSNPWVDIVVSKLTEITDLDSYDREATL